MRTHHGHSHTIMFFVNFALLSTCCMGQARQPTESNPSSDRSNQEPRTSATEGGAVFALDPKAEPLAVSLGRQELLSRGEREFCESKDPNKLYSVPVLDDKGEVVYQIEEVTGLELRESMTNILVSYYSARDKKLKQELRKKIDDFMRHQDSELIFPIDPTKEPLAASHAINWTLKERRFVESFDPKKILKTLRLDEKRKPIPVVEKLQGLRIRKAFIFIKAYSQLEALDKQSTKELNKEIYGFEGCTTPRQSEIERGAGEIERALRR